MAYKLIIATCVTVEMRAPFFVGSLELLDRPITTTIDLIAIYKLIYFVVNIQRKLNSWTYM